MSEREQDAAEIWNADNVVIQEQKETAIYKNPNGDLVIRQRGEDFEDDPFVVISRSNVRSLLAALGVFANNEGL